MAAYLALNQFAGTGGVMQIEIAFKGNPGGSAAAPYFKAADVRAIVFTPATSVSVSSQYDIALTQVNANTFKTVAAVPLGKVLRVFRMTEDGYPLVDFAALQVVTENDLDVLSKQVVFLVEEAKDAANLASEAANNALTTAVAANVGSNYAIDTANNAYYRSVDAINAANAATQVANNSISQAAAALAAAQSADRHATNVETLASQATALATTAGQNAATALSTANAASTLANGVDAKATSALSNANSALQVANSAQSTANGVSAKADNALSTANAAASSASAAMSTANAVDAKAQSALDKANAATSTANAAQTAVANKQDSTAALRALATATPAANTIPFWTSPTVAGAYTRTDVLNFLGLGPTNSPTFGGIETQGVDLHAGDDGLDYSVRLRSATGEVFSVLSASNPTAPMLTVNQGGLAVPGALSSGNNVDAGGSVIARSGRLAVYAMTNADNANAQFCNPDGSIRGVVYVDKDKVGRVQLNGRDHTTFQADGSLDVAGAARVAGQLSATGAGGFVWSYGRVFTGQGNSYLETDGNLFGSAWSGGLSQWLANNKQNKFVFQANKVDLGSPAGTGLLQTRINFFSGIANPVVTCTLFKSGGANQFETTTIAIDSNGFTVTYQAQGGLNLILHWIACNPTNV